MLVQKREPYIEDKLSGSNSRTADGTCSASNFNHDDSWLILFLLPLRRSLYRIDLSDPQSSIGQEGQSTDLCLQANPHTIRFPCLVTDTVAKCRIKNAALLICRFWDYCTSRSQLKQS
ncbi:hypothetical protein T4C_6684 [Trichinella pseudospiralis]|uniref:Uncharacterized protein n=1 Tax=Trichinella pseudospiralis TaxID=6337 RepID=A0A0V1IUW1_TRIPS|nr:hypothetical protein T4C_6684 [Trichinella pseudospiralis]